MGAIGYGSFMNDDALEWISTLEGSEGFEAISEAFDAVFEEGDFMEPSVAFEALAAAEVIAAMLGQSAPDLPDEVTTWAAGKKPPKATLIKKAQRAVKLVARDSGLNDSWIDPDGPAHWQEHVNGVLQRLSADAA